MSKSRPKEEDLECFHFKNGGIMRFLASLQTGQSSFGRDLDNMYVDGYIPGGSDGPFDSMWTV